MINGIFLMVNVEIRAESNKPSQHLDILKVKLIGNSSLADGKLVDLPTSLDRNSDWLYVKTWSYEE